MTTPRPNRLDFHCHSTRSDGVLEPHELYGQMQRFGMRLVALTDHDSVDGYRELAAAGLGREASPAGPRLIPGVEINTVLPPDWPFPRDEIHVLGLGIDPDDDALEDALASQRRQRLQRFDEMVERVRRLGIPIDDVLPSVLRHETDAAGRPHVARALRELGVVESFEEAFERFLKRVRPAYVLRMGLGPAAAIAAIRHAGGVASLAHYPDAPERPELLDHLEEAGLNGLEVHYFAWHRRFAPDVRRRLADVAAARGLLATGGTDYHGDEMSYAEAQAGAFIPAEVGERLLEALETSRAAAR